MKTYTSFCIFHLSFALFVQAFFLFGENQEPLLFCIKVCPLYCSPRRHDLDASSLIYVDEPPPFIHHDWYDHEVIPYNFDPYYFCKPPKSTTTTTTTPAPTTTTTEEPSDNSYTNNSRDNPVRVPPQPRPQASPENSNLWEPPSNILNIGRSDLDPFAAPGGGMIFNPFSPGRDIENPGLGIPDGLPRFYYF